MSIYGNYDKQNKVYTESEVYEILAETDLYLSSTNYIYIYEEANIDASREVVQCFKNIKQNYKDCKAAIKSKDWKTAKSELQAMKKEVARSKRQAKDTLSDKKVTTAVIGFFLHEITSILKITPFLFIPIIGPMAGSVINLIDFVETFLKTIKEIDNNEDPVNALNLYRSRILVCYDRIEKELNRLEAIINEQERLSK